MNAEPVRIGPIELRCDDGVTEIAADIGIRGDTQRIWDRVHGAAAAPAPKRSWLPRCSPHR